MWKKKQYVTKEVVARFRALCNRISVIYRKLSDDAMLYDLICKVQSLVSKVNFSSYLLRVVVRKTREIDYGKCIK